MAPPGSKRSPQEELTGRVKRIVKNRDARRIDMDSQDPLAAQLGRPLTSKQQAMARLKQINTLQTSIQTASYAVNVLASQSVPRDLRRRTASHDPKRLPQRLRERAAKEIEKAPPVKRRAKRCMRKRRPKSRVEEYLRRQRNNKWLETHIWHTKRMKMMDIWGYRLALHPNVKAERPCYRAFSYLSLLHDASYYCCLEWVGNRQSIVSVLDPIMDPFMPSVGSARYIKGQRVGHGLLYQCYPTHFLCPVTFLWRSHPKQQNHSQLWMWVHPSVLSQVLSLFQTHLLNKQDIQLINQKGELIRFDFTGPRSTALLQAVLDPVDDNAPNSQIWRDLSSLRSSSSLSLGTVLGLNVKDPRLTFPQKVPPRNNTNSAEMDARIQHLCLHWPSHASESDLWDRSLCKSINEKKLSDHTLLMRRQKSQKDETTTATSSSSIIPWTSADASIPILLLQRGSVPSNSASEDGNHSREVCQGWTLLLPRGWGMAFWKSFVFAGARTGGLRDSRSMHFESGLAAYPYDFPGTTAWYDLRERYKEKAEQVWQKKPPAKRVQHDLLGRKHPFEAAFETLISSSSSLPSKAQYWTIQECKLLSILLSLLSLQQLNDTDLTDTLQRRQMWSVNKETLLKACETALVKVHLVLISGGKPVQNASIHAIDDSANPIGYLTTAGFSLSQSCGAGIGACTLVALHRLLNMNSQRHVQGSHDYKRLPRLSVFVKNPSSMKLRPALLSVIF